MNYTHDVFISYRRVRKLRDWIEKYFYGQFRDALELELGREPRLFWDEEGVSEGDLWEEKILDGLKSAICMVSILSKPYFQSPWCLAEWQTFWKRSEVVDLKLSSLIFPIRWHDGDDYPDFAKAIKPIDFREYAVTAAAFEFTQQFLDYEVMLKRFAEIVSERVQKAPAYSDQWPVVKPDNISTSSETENWKHEL